MVASLSATPSNTPLCRCPCDGQWQAPLSSCGIGEDFMNCVCNHSFDNFSSVHKSIGKNINFSRIGIKKLAGKAKGLAHDTFLWCYQTCGKCCIIFSFSFLASQSSCGCACISQSLKALPLQGNPHCFRRWSLAMHQPLATSLHITIVLIYSIFLWPFFSASKPHLPLSSLEMEYLKGCSCLFEYATSWFSYQSTTRRWQMPEIQLAYPSQGKKKPTGLQLTSPIPEYQIAFPLRNNSMNKFEWQSVV